jgi:hypothetical protein
MEEANRFLTYRWQMGNIYLCGGQIDLKKWLTTETLLLLLLGV